MNTSDTHAAKRAHLNKSLAKTFGQPYNCSTGTGGRTTQAASRPAHNGTISGKHFLCKPNNWGHGV
jgi:hypothetical protein